MPNIQSAKKRVKIIAKKTAANKASRSELKSLIKSADVAVKTDAADKEAAVRLAIKKVDQAAAKGILPKNTASRKKSALAKSLNG